MCGLFALALDSALAAMDQQLLAPDSLLAIEGQQPMVPDSLLAVVYQQLTTLDALLADMDQQLTALDSLLANMNQQLMAPDSVLADMDQQLTTPDSVLAVMDQQLMGSWWMQQGYSFWGAWALTFLWLQKPSNRYNTTPHCARPDCFSCQRWLCSKTQTIINTCAGFCARGVRPLPVYIQSMLCTHFHSKHPPYSYPLPKPCGNQAHILFCLTHSALRSDEILLVCKGGQV